MNNSCKSPSCNKAAADNTSNNTNNTNDHKTDYNDDLESKLQTVAMKFIQKRDEAYRSHHLALERLKLVQNEADTLSALMDDLRNKLTELHKRGGMKNSPATKEELKNLRDDVEKLSNEFCFQHPEVVLKRAKAAQMKETTELAKKQFDCNRNYLEQIVRSRRLQVEKYKEECFRQKDEENQSYHEGSSSPIFNEVESSGSDGYLKKNAMDMKQKFQKELQLSDPDGKRLFTKWTLVVQEKTDTIRLHNDQLENQKKELERVVAQYEKEQPNDCIDDSTTFNTHNLLASDHVDQKKFVPTDSSSIQYEDVNAAASINKDGNNCISEMIELTNDTTTETRTIDAAPPAVQDIQPDQEIN